MKGSAANTSKLAKNAYRIFRDTLQLYRCYFSWRSWERRVKSQSLRQLQDHQWSQLRRLLDFAYREVPLYRDKFDAAGFTPDKIETPDDLLRLPTLTKDEIRRNFPDRILPRGRTYDPRKMGQTSGSTSESLHFVLSDRIWNRSLHFSIISRAGRITNLPVFFLTTPICTPASCSIDDDLAYRGPLHDMLMHVPPLRHMAGPVGLPSSDNVLSASDEYLEGLAELLGAYRESIMVADPVYLGALARYLRRHGKSVPRFAFIITTFELLTGSLRDLLRDVFRCEIFVQYGASEVPTIALECEQSTLHLQMNNVFAEVMRDGRAAGPGEVGRVVLTDLQNYNMPLIRYDIGDLVRVGKTPCSCERNSSTLESVEGRANDTVAGNGCGHLTHLEVDAVFRGLAGIAAYRVSQRASRGYRLEILRDSGSEELNEQELLSRCRSTFGGEPLRGVEYVRRLRTLSSNKYQFVATDDAAFPPVEAPGVHARP